jgi:hypothetical protein
MKRPKPIRAMKKAPCEMYHVNLMGEGHIVCYNCEYINAYNQAIQDILDRRKTKEGLKK